MTTYWFIKMKLIFCLTTILDLLEFFSFNSFVHDGSFQSGVNKSTESPDIQHDSGDELILAGKKTKDIQGYVWYECERSGEKFEKLIKSIRI
jgi:hypothetical protein